MFSGYLLGNAVTGSYAVQPDCSLVWRLQNDSGAFQNFAGTLSADMLSGEFRQTDPGGVHHGILRKAPEQCSGAELRQQYRYSVSGSTTPMQEGDTSQAVAARGTLDVSRNGTFHVDAECIVDFDLLLSGVNQRLVSLHMRGILAEGGQEILAIQTDPGAMVAARLDAGLQ
jgi:hypothetical protein